LETHELQTAGAAGQMPYGSIRLTAGLAFCLGLILAVVGGLATSSAAR
jgi:formate/nitrite transporter FocA (FNT family)